MRRRNERVYLVLTKSGIENGLPGYCEKSGIAMVSFLLDGTETKTFIFPTYEERSMLSKQGYTQKFVRVLTPTEARDYTGMLYTHFRKLNES